MDTVLISPYAVVLVLVCSVTLLLSHDWRISIAALGVQYLGVFLLISVSWPTEYAVVKLVAGWMSASILGVSKEIPNVDAQPSNRVWPTEWLFRLMAAALIVIAVISLSTEVEDFIPNITQMQVIGGLLLLGMGLLHHSLTQHALQALIALLTTLSGFEIIYASVESSTLVTGLIATINLGIAFVGAYLLATHSVEESI